MGLWSAGLTLWCNGSFCLETCLVFFMWQNWWICPSLVHVEAVKRLSSFSGAMVGSPINILVFLTRGNLFLN